MRWSFSASSILRPLSDVLAYRTLTHANRPVKGADAGPAQMSLSILIPFQKTVDRQFSIYLQIVTQS